MSLSRKHFAVLLLALSAACVDAPTEPGRMQSLPAITPRLVMPPGTTPASYGIVIDTVELTIFQQDTLCGPDCQPAVAEPGQLFRSMLLARADSLLLDTAVAWPADQEAFQFRYDLPTPPPGHELYVSLSFKSGGGYMFQGSVQVDFTRGDIRLPEIPMYYFGPGYLADEVQMAPGDTAMAPGDTLQFSATAFQNAVALDTAYLSWRVSDPTVARVDHLGRVTLRAGALGSSFLVIAGIPSGIAAATRVSVPQPVTALQEISGDSQSVPIYTQAPKPLTVRAVDAQAKPVAGARIRFAPVAGPPTAQVMDTVVFTDLFGIARSGPVPTAVGNATVVAQVSGTPQIVTFTLTGTAAPNAFVLFAGDSGAGGYQLYRADSSGGNRVQIGFLTSASVRFAGPRWNPARNRVAYTNYNANAAAFQLLLTTGIGDSTATLVTDIAPFNPHFSPTGKKLAFLCGTDPTDEYNGEVCTVDGVDGVMGTLNGAGDGAGHVIVSQTVPSRPTGPGAFAWRPDASTRIAFARDSVVDSVFGIVSSRIYDVNGDGTAVTPLAPPVMDVGGGPLRVALTMDWSPDGSLIVFSATDTTPFGRYSTSLYLLNVATGGLRRLTTTSPNFYGDVYPRFSPDGQRVLFQRLASQGVGAMQTDFFVVRTVGGTPSRVTWDSFNWGGGYAWSRGGDWSPDGGSVVITAPNGLGTGGLSAYRVPLGLTSQAEYVAGRVLVGTAGIAGLNDHMVSWGP